jgi:heparan-sulfate lyase
MTNNMLPLRIGISPAVATHFWMIQAPFIAPGAPHRRSSVETRVGFQLTATDWIVQFECESAPAQKPSGETLRAFGDPDLWQAEYVQVQMPLGDDGACLHLSIGRSEQMVSERFDKLRDPIAGWSASAEETACGWRARITLPRAQVPDPLKLRLARWVPGEGITRWPTPFGTWWHVESPDFLEIDPREDSSGESLDAEAEAWMQRREAALFAATGTPEPAAIPRGEWWRHARGFLNIPLVREGDFLRHLQHRLQEQPWLAFGVLPPPNMELCRNLLESRVYYEGTVLDLGQRPDWDSDHDNAFVMRHATRFDFLADLVAAFRHSGDEAYAHSAVALIESWLERNDVRQSLMPNRYPVRWAVRIITSHRLVCMMRTLFSLLPAGVVSEELFLRIYAATREVAEVLSSALARLYPKNHSIIVGDHMVQLSVLCNELSAAESIRDCYWEHLRRALKVQFLPDGVQSELSTSYHLVCYMRLTEATALCEEAGVAVPDDITAWRRRILTVAAKYLFPNGQLAAFNDGSMRGSVDAIGQGKNSLRELVLEHGPALGADEALAIASGGELGQAAMPISDALPYAGHYMLRDGLAPGSMALAFDAGPLGISHAHEDALSLMLVRYGKALLIDIGSGAYDPGVPMRLYSTSTHSHSTICIDGKGQAAGALPQFWKRSSPWEGHHFFGENIQFAHGEYSYGYGEGGAIRVLHQRAVLFVNQSYILLVDYLLGEGTHLVESHFAVAPLPYEITPRGLRTTSGDGDLDIALLHPKQAEVVVACGQEEPFAGWMPQGSYHVAPHPRLTFRLENQAMPCCLLTLLSPFQEQGEIAVPKIHESADSIQVEIERAGMRSHVTCSRLPLDITLSHGHSRLHINSRQDGQLDFTETN